MFDIVNNKLEILPEVLTYPCMRRLYDRDKSKTKEIALMQFSYLYHMYNRHSSCWGIRDDLKQKEVLDLVGLKNTDWIPEKDALFFECITYYKRILGYSPKHYALECAKEGLYIMGDKMKDDKSKINDIQKVMQSMDNAFDDFDNLKKKADRDEIEEGVAKIKGNMRLGKRQFA
jgi:hypothetical protein